MGAPPKTKGWEPLEDAELDAALRTMVALIACYRNRATILPDVDVRTEASLRRVLALLQDCASAQRDLNERLAAVELVESVEVVLRKRPRNVRDVLRASWSKFAGRANDRSRFLSEEQFATLLISSTDVTVSGGAVQAANAAVGGVLSQLDPYVSTRPQRGSNLRDWRKQFKGFPQRELAYFGANVSQREIVLAAVRALGGRAFVADALATLPSELAVELATATRGGLQAIIRSRAGVLIQAAQGYAGRDGGILGRGWSKRQRKTPPPSDPASLVEFDAPALPVRTRLDGAEASDPAERLQDDGPMTGLLRSLGKLPIRARMEIVDDHESAPAPTRGHTKAALVPPMSAGKAKRSRGN